MYSIAPLVVERVPLAPGEGEDAGGEGVEGAEGVRVEVEFGGKTVLEAHLKPLPVTHVVSQGDILEFNSTAKIFACVIT